MAISYWLMGVALAVQEAPPAEAPAEEPAVSAPVAAETAEPAPAVEPAPAAAAIAKSDAEKFIAECGSRRFETSANSNNNGKLRKAKILLCAKSGDSDEQWIATLEKAASSVVASKELSIEAKAKISGALQTEIELLRGKLAAN